MARWFFGGVAWAGQLGEAAMIGPDRAAKSIDSGNGEISDMPELLTFGAVGNVSLKYVNG